MKNCSHFKNNISAYIDNELNENDRCEFENHIKECDKCQSEFSKILSISNALSLSEIEVPDNYLSSLRARIASESIEKKKKSIFTYVNYRTCSAVFAVFLLVAALKTPVYENILKYRSDTYYSQEEITENKNDAILEETNNTQEEILQVVTPEKTEPKTAQNTESIAPVSETENNEVEIYEGIIEEYDIGEGASGGGGASGASPYGISPARMISNSYSATILKTDESIVLLEKYFDKINSESIYGRITFENYESFKEEIAPYIVNEDIHIFEQGIEVDIEIFLN